MEEGLQDQPKTGRPPDVPKETMIKIRNELAESNTVWDFRQVISFNRYFSCKSIKEKNKNTTFITIDFNNEKEIKKLIKLSNKN